MALVPKTNPDVAMPLQSKTSTTTGDNLANLPLSQYQDVVGPENPFEKTYGSRKLDIQKTSIDSYVFNTQYDTYQRHGYALDAASGRVLGDYNAYTSASMPKAKKAKTKHEMVLPDDDDDDAGPWASFADERQPFRLPAVAASTSNELGNKRDREEEKDYQAEENSKQQRNLKHVDDKEQDEENEEEGADRSGNEKAIDSLSSDPTVHIVEPDPEDEKWQRVNERKMTFALPPRPPRGSQPRPASSTFHGQSERDYQGRAWCTAPSGVRPDNDHECYPPKKCIKKYVGHSKGVQGIEFFPGTGHLLLSGSMDGKCKIWDTMNDRNLLRTYNGHSEAVRSINFNSNGSEFVASSYDRYVRLWDVETGQTKGTFSNRQMAYQALFAPRDNNIILTACSDNKIHQWDLRSGSICLEYNHHLAPVNALMFFDDGRKFVSTSDDKKILVWEYDTPVPIKYIAEPEMFSIPALALHPSNAFMAGQSMDSSIVVYGVSDTISGSRKKVFKNHNNSGYACQISFSPDGKFMVSGDGFGKFYVWDWKSSKIIRKFQAHESGPCIGATWHPINPSWMATCGWDGVIKLWD